MSNSYRRSKLRSLIREYLTESECCRCFNEEIQSWKFNLYSLNSLLCMFDSVSGDLYINVDIIFTPEHFEHYKLLMEAYVDTRSTSAIHYIDEEQLILKNNHNNGK